MEPQGGVKKPPKCCETNYQHEETGYCWSIYELHLNSTELDNVIESQQ